MLVKDVCIIVKNKNKQQHTQKKLVDFGKMSRQRFNKKNVVGLYALKQRNKQKQKTMKLI